MSDELEFDPPVRLGKMMDWIENQMTEWAHEVINDYGWDPEELTQEQVDALQVWVDDNDGWADVTMMGFRNVISWQENRLWEEENDNA